MADSGTQPYSFSAVENATRNFRLLSNELEEFTAEMVKLVDESLNQINKIRKQNLEVSSEGKTVCIELRNMLNEAYSYATEIDNFAWNAERERTKWLALKALQQTKPDFGPINAYIGHTKLCIGRAKEKHAIFKESCNGVAERLVIVSEDSRDRASVQGSKQLKAQVAGGVIAGGAMAAGLGAGGSVAATGIGLSLAVGIPTLGIGTIIGLVVTGVAAPAVGLGVGGAAAGITHAVAKNYKEKKMTFLHLAGCINMMAQKATELDSGLSKINITMEDFSELVDDVTQHSKDHKKSMLPVLDAVQLLYKRLGEFHVVSHKCCSTLESRVGTLRRFNELHCS